MKNVIPALVLLLTTTITGCIGLGSPLPEPKPLPTVSVDSIYCLTVISGNSAAFSNTVGSDDFCFTSLASCEEAPKPGVTRYRCDPQTDAYGFTVGSADGSSRVVAMRVDYQAQQRLDYIQSRGYGTNVGTLHHYITTP